MSEHTYSTDGPQCPHCGFQITPDDPFYFNESRYLEDECSDCGKKFKVEVYTQTSWTTRPYQSETV